METKIKLTIQEIVEDFYCLGQEEGYIDGLCDSGQINETNLKAYLDFMIKLSKKYIPKTYEKVIDNKKTDDENGLELSKILYENFKEIFCQLV